MNINDAVELKMNPQIPTLAAGDVVKVRTKVVEGEKVRTQTFQGVVIRVKHGGSSACFTVRRVAYGVGVERSFPIYSPLVEGVEVVRHGKVRRSRLYYLRGLSARASRIKERRVAEIVPTEGEAPKPEEMAPEVVPTEAAPVAVTAAAPEAPKAEVKEQPKAEAKPAEAPKAPEKPETK